MNSDRVLDVGIRLIHTLYNVLWAFLMYSGDGTDAMHQTAS